MRLRRIFEDGAEFDLVRVVSAVVRIDDSTLPGMMMVPLATGVRMGAPEGHALWGGQQGRQQQ